MFSSALRPIARRTARSFSTRATSSSTTSSFTARHGLIAASTLLAVGGSIAYSNERRKLHLETPSPRVSVLDQPSLKVPLHKPSEEHGTKTPEIIEEKKAEAEETSGSQGAFNEETGEINWDCPCLGGMADGPCGEQFKAAFSCFVFSEAEPKGMDCVEKFKNMQDCFRLHPEIYGEEIDDDDEEESVSAGAGSDLPDGAISGKSLPQGHPDLKDVPKAPNAEPPANSPIIGLTHENTMTKGVVKLQPKGNRDDKKKGFVPSSGDGTA